MSARVWCMFKSDIKTWNLSIYAPSLLLFVLTEQYGLRLILDADEDEYIYAVTPNKGARVSVHHPDQIPFPEDNGFNVAGAFRTGVSVSQVSSLDFRKFHNQIY